MIPIVSVWMVTYNHEKYIGQALESVLSQKTNFQFEIVIGEDCSTDTTRAILKEYQNKFPTIINAVYQDNNVGPFRNAYKFTLPKCRGKYVACLEGDDYWIDPYKLQKQMDFLENNPDYGMVYSKAKVYIEKDKKFKKRGFGKALSYFDELILGNYISTPTVMFRKELSFVYLKEIEPENHKWLMNDYPLWLYIASVSKIKYLNYPSSVYRIIENSAAHSTFIKEILFVESYHAIKLFYIKKLGYSHLIKKIWEKLFLGKAYIYAFKNEENISELVKEINDFNDKTFKLRILKLLLNNWLFRKILKLYWNI
jgi:glycosyltransferase involved in cell wall biosynthesis